MSDVIDKILLSIPSMGFNSNIYIFNKKVLIDTGHDTSYAQKIIDKLKSIDVKIEKIIITHGHPDHSGNAFVFQKEYDADVYAHESLQRTFKRLGGKYHPVVDGTIIKVDDEYELEVIHTPGHTPGDISIFNAKLKMLFSGDCVFSHGNVGRTDLPGSSHSQLVESIEKLTKLDVEYLYPGHMGAVSNAKAHIKQSLSFAKEFY